MAWPPTLPPSTRANSTPQLDAHISDHNSAAEALAELTLQVSRIGSGVDALFTVGDVNVANGERQPATACTIDRSTEEPSPYVVSGAKLILPWQGRYLVSCTGRLSLGGRNIPDGARFIWRIMDDSQVTVGDHMEAGASLNILPGGGTWNIAGRSYITAQSAGAALTAEAGSISGDAGLSNCTVVGAVAYLGP